jgi:hypothetical protein
MLILGYFWDILGYSAIFWDIVPRTLNECQLSFEQFEHPYYYYRKNLSTPSQYKLFKLSALRAPPFKKERVALLVGNARIKVIPLTPSARRVCRLTP